MSGTDLDTKTGNSSYLNKMLNIHEKLLNQAMDISEKKPATSIQIVGIFILFIAISLKSMSTLPFGGLKIYFTTIDFSIMMTFGTMFILYSSYISLTEYKNHVRWYDAQLKISGENSQKAFEVIVNHAPPTALGQPPVMRGNVSAVSTPPGVG